MNSSCPGVNLGLQQVGNLKNKVVLPDFNLIPAHGYLRIRTVWLRELAAWKIPLPK